jgi:hypothetical protein
VVTFLDEAALEEFLADPNAMPDPSIPTLGNLQDLRKGLPNSRRLPKNNSFYVLEATVDPGGNRLALHRAFRNKEDLYKGLKQFFHPWFVWQILFSQHSTVVVHTFESWDLPPTTLELREVMQVLLRPKPGSEPTLPDGGGLAYFYLHEGEDSTPKRWLGCAKSSDDRELDLGAVLTSGRVQDFRFPRFQLTAPDEFPELELSNPSAPFEYGYQWSGGEVSGWVPMTVAYGHGQVQIPFQRNLNVES